MKAATVANIGGEAFQIATNRETTVGEMTEMLADTLAAKGITNILVTNSESRPPGDVKRNYSDTTKAGTRLNWQPLTDLETGLARTVEYFLE